MEALAPRSRGGLDAYCRLCRNQKNKESYARNSSKRKTSNSERWLEKQYKYPAYQSRWRKNNRTRLSAEHRAQHLKRVYGITIADYERLLEGQGGCCAICGTSKPWSRSDYFAVDHDHASGKVRALLCHRCNTGLGYFKDNPSFLRKAAQYVESFK